MTAGTKWGEHDGVRYLVADYRGLDDAGQHALLREVAGVVASEPVGTPVLVRNDPTMPTLEYSRLAMELGRTVFKPRRTRMAILGLSTPALMGLRTFTAVTGGRSVAAFRDEEQAVAFLVQGALRGPGAGGVRGAAPHP